MSEAVVTAEKADALDARRLRILEAVLMERARQDDKWGVAALQTGSFEQRLTILTEEVGEVAKATLERDSTQLWTETVHVAAVALANLEMLAERFQHPERPLW